MIQSLSRRTAAVGAVGAVLHASSMSPQCRKQGAAPRITSPARRFGLRGSGSPRRPGKPSQMADAFAFTLLEVLIVLTIVVAFLAIAWPRMRGMAARTELREAAVEFKTACAEARELAVRSGAPVVVRYQCGGSAFGLCADGSSPRSGEPSEVGQRGLVPNDQPAFETEPDRDDSPQTVGESVPVDRVGESIADGSPGHFDSVVDQTFELPSGIRFGFAGQSREISSADPPENAFSEGERAETAPSSGAWALGNQGTQASEAITFYPDGRGSPANVLLAAVDSGDSIALTVRGLTGTVQIGDVRKAVKTSPDSLSGQPGNPESRDAIP